MNTATTQKIGFSAAALTSAAGLIELVAGSTSWTGDKSQPTALGFLTIGLGLVMAGAALSTTRRQSTGALLAAAGGLAVPPLVTLTTAGLAAFPGAIVGIGAGFLVVRHANERGSIRQKIAWEWPIVLLVGLVVIYLAFGAVSGAVGLLGVAGAAATIVALRIARRSQATAAVVLVIGVAPFAVAVWWSIAVPFTAALLIAIGLPQLQRRGHQKIDPTQAAEPII